MPCHATTFEGILGASLSEVVQERALAAAFST